MSKPDATIEVLGLRETVEMLNTLPVLVQLDLMRRVNRQLASRIVKPRIKAAIPFSAELKESVKVKNSRKNRTAVLVGPTMVSSDNPKTGQYQRGRAARLRFLEKGTKGRRSKQGYNRGDITGVKLIEPAIDSSIPEVVLKLQTEYGKMINRHIQNKTKAINRKIKKQLALRK